MDACARVRVRECPYAHSSRVSVHVGVMLHTRVRGGRSYSKRSFQGKGPGWLSWHIARVAIVHFLVGFNVNLSSYLNLESGQKHYRSVTLLPEVEFFFC